MFSARSEIVDDERADIVADDPDPLQAEGVEQGDHVVRQGVGAGPVGAPAARGASATASIPAWTTSTGPSRREVDVAFTGPPPDD